MTISSAGEPFPSETSFGDARFCARNDKRGASIRSHRQLRSGRSPSRTHRTAKPQKDFSIKVSSRTQVVPIPTARVNFNLAPMSYLSWTRVYASQGKSGNFLFFRNGQTCASRRMVTGLLHATVKWPPDHRMGTLSRRQIMTRSTRPPSAVRIPGAARRFARRVAVPVLAASAVVMAVMGNSASAGIVPTVGLATAGNFSVLAGTTVTNIGPSILGQSLGLSPGPATTGFPPGMVLPPGTTEVANAVSLQAQSDLTAAYLDAANRPVEFTQVNPDLVGLTLAPGVYSGSSKAPLSLSGQLILDGQGNNAAVFIFQTDSTLITSSASSILLINGASECNIFWQVGSSATLGTGSRFVGNILALTSISVQTGVTVQGRALARNGAVTLDNDVFTQPSCVGSTVTAPTTTVAATTPTTVGVTNITLPRTGQDVGATPYLGGIALALGAGALVLARRRRPAM